MSALEEERLLAGGNVNTVVRAGNTVRRSAGAWTPTIHRLLAHTRQRGVGWLPEPLGYDELGREVLSFIPGDVPHDMPSWLWSEAVLAEIARALRQWHDATVDFDDANAVWNLAARGPREVICHNDFAPYNCVFRAGRFAGAIDFDMCAPGTRLWDIAYAAYRFVPLMPPAEADVADGAQERSPFSVAEMAPRAGAFLDAYAGKEEELRYGLEALLEVLAERLESIAQWTDRHSAERGSPTLANHGRMYRAHARWISSGFRQAMLF